MWRQGTKRALRTLRTERLFFVVATGAFAVCICVGTLAFAIVDAVALRPLVFRDSSRLVMLWSSMEKSPRLALSGSDFLEWKSELVNVEDLAAIQASNFNLALKGKAVEVQGARVTQNTFSLLGAELLCGSGSLPDTDARTAVISFRLWSSAFNKNPTLCGQTIELDGAAVVVTGILPVGFHLTYIVQDYDVLVPLDKSKLNATASSERYLRVVGRLKNGATIAQLNRELAVVSANSAKAYPKTNGGIGAWAEPLRYWLLRDSPRIVWTVLMLVLLVCTVALGNITALFLARYIRRRDELKIRIALGASSLQLAGEVLVESLVFSAAGYIVGLLLLSVLVPTFSLLMPSNILRANELAMDWRVCLFGAGFGLVACILVILPSLVLVTKEALARTFNLASIVGHHNQPYSLRNIIMAAQFMLVTIVVSVATLAGKDFIALRSAKLGFIPDHVLTAELSPTHSQYPDRDALIQYFDNVLDGIQGIPGVTNASVTSSFPLSGDDRIVFAELADTKKSRHVKTAYRIVSSGYFEVMQIPFLHGKKFVDGKREGAQEAVINRLLSSHLWPGQDPIGKDLLIQLSPSVKKRLTVVGLVDNIHHTGLLDKDEESEIYVSYHQEEPMHMFAVARASGPPAQFLRAFEQQITRIGSGQHFSLDDPKTLMGIIDVILQRPRFYATALLLMSAATVVLALYGLMGTTIYVTRQRASEIAVRLCLGATFKDIFLTVSFTVLASAGIGLIGGTLTCFYVIPSIITRLQLTVGFTVGIQISISFLLALISVLGICLPIRNAIKIEPSQLLRCQ